MKATLIVKISLAAERRYYRLKEWHRYFAWLPVWVGENDCRWLETIERKGADSGGYDGIVWSWDYRALDKSGERPQS